MQSAMQPRSPIIIIFIYALSVRVVWEENYRRSTIINTNNLFVYNFISTEKELLLYTTLHTQKDILGNVSDDFKGAIEAINYAVNKKDDYSIHRFFNLQKVKIGEILNEEYKSKYYFLFFNNCKREKAEFTMTKIIKIF